MLKINCLVIVAVSQLVWCSSINSQDRIDSLISKGQYLTAFELLGDCADTSSVDCLLKKVDLALNYHLNSYFHRSFSFTNLRPGEELKQLRGEKALGVTPVVFQIDSVLHHLSSQYPDDYRIVKALGDFYNRIYYDFGDRWGEPSEALLEKSNAYYEKAIEHGVFDYYSLYALGYYQSLNQNYFAAQKWFIKSLAIKANEPLTNYSLAVTYLLDGLPQKGIKYAVRAFHLYQDSIEKSDAARVSGILFLKEQNVEYAMNYFQEADKLCPGYRPNLLYILNASLKLEDDSLIVANGYKVLESDLYAPELADELNGLFLREGQGRLLLQIYEQALRDYKTDMEACGNVCFHYGKLLYKQGNKRKAKRMIKRSRQFFSKVFEDSHQVFEAITQTLEHLNTNR
ncbi:tetratricopeptide repeat protein [Carboxylicivirga taeanensis]|uniref:tetratricopeptide repeat protein n=1 Tax=Carboxylicivirga taeanensis TaxID=1416875 RepID=UPI003F6E2750